MAFSLFMIVVSLLLGLLGISKLYGEWSQHHGE